MLLTVRRALDVVLVCASWCVAGTFTQVSVSIDFPCGLSADQTGTSSASRGIHCSLPPEEAPPEGALGRAFGSAASLLEAGPPLSFELRTTTGALGVGVWAAASALAGLELPLIITGGTGPGTADFWFHVGAEFCDGPADFSYKADHGASGEGNIGLCGVMMWRAPVSFQFGVPFQYRASVSGSVDDSAGLGRGMTAGALLDRIEIFDQAGNLVPTALVVIVPEPAGLLTLPAGLLALVAFAALRRRSRQSR